MPRFALKMEPGSRPDESNALADRWEQLLDRSQRPVEWARTVRAGLVVVNGLLPVFRNRPQPAISPDGNVLLWLDGELWDRESALRSAGVAAGEELSDPELCLRLYLQQGERFHERLNGQLVIAVYDDRRKRLLVANDRYAYRSLFWAQEGESFVCATEIKSVLAAMRAAPRVDPAGVLELFAYAHQFDDRTMFQGVHALPPASRLIWERGRVTIESYWQFGFPAQPATESEDELMEELAARLERACRRQSGGPGRIGISLSAGLDSRFVAAALSRSAQPECAYTTGYDDSLDVLGARELAATYGIRHHHLVPLPNYLSRVGAEVVWRTEGAFPFLDATSIQFHERTRPELDIILTGHGGGPLSGQQLMPLPVLDRRSFDLASYLFRRDLSAPPETMRKLFADRLWNAEWSPMRERYYAAVESLGDQRRSISDAGIVMNLRWKQPRHTNHSPQVDRYDFEVRPPLLDYDVVDFFQAVPFRLRFAQRLYKRTLARHFPEAARLPWSKTGKPVPGGTAEILTDFYARCGRTYLEKKLPALGRLRRERVRTCHVVGDEMRRDVALKSGILDPFVNGDSFPDEILDRDTMRRLVDEHWSGAANHVDPLGCLATVALLYRQFLEHGLQAPPMAGPTQPSSLHTHASRPRTLQEAA